MPYYETPFFWMYRDGENWLVMNPRGWVNLAGIELIGAFFLGPIEVWVNV